MLKLARVQARGQVTLPREVRKWLAIKPKDLLAFELNPDGHVRLSVVPFISATELFARYPGDGQAVDMAALRREAEEAAAEAFMHTPDGVRHAG